MKVKLALVAAVAGGTVLGVAGSCFGWWVAQDWRLPEWLKVNSGPWIVLGALLALAGVVIATTAQSRAAREDRLTADRRAADDREDANRRADADRRHLQEQARTDRQLRSLEALSERSDALQRAREDRAHNRQLILEEREAQEVRGRREWFRDKQFAAYSVLLDLTHQVNRDIQHPDRTVANSIDALDRAVTAAKAVTIDSDVRDHLQRALSELWDTATANQIGESTKRLAILQHFAYQQIQRHTESQKPSGEPS